MATFPTIADLRGLPDPLLQYRWTLIIANVPGGGDGRRLQYQCKTSSIPGLSNEEVTVTTHGIDLHFAGRQMYNGTLATTFYETRDLMVYQSLRGWLDYARNSRAGTGNYKDNYAVSAQLLLLDDTVTTIKTVDLTGFFPKEITEAGLDGSSSGVVEFSVNWSFDISTLS